MNLQQVAFECCRRLRQFDQPPYVVLHDGKGKMLMTVMTKAVVTIDTVPFVALVDSVRRDYVEQDVVDILRTWGVVVRA